MAAKFVLKQNDSPRGQNAADSPTLAEYVFSGDLFTIGSDSTNSLTLTEAAAEQAVVVREGEQLTLINSADGTSLNGENLRREAIYPLGAGDRIGVGNYTIFVVDDENNSNNGAASENNEPNDEPTTGESLAVAAFAADRNQVLSNPNKNASVKTAGGAANSSNNFAAVLDTLRTEEDSFYFVVKKKEIEIARLALEQTEVPVGADDKNQIVFDIKRITTVFGVVRKDWSGIVLEANRRAAVFVNGDALEAAAPRRLRNNDRVSFAAPVESNTTLVLHEPSLLVALEPLLSARSVSNNGANNTATVLATGQTASLIKTKTKLPFFERTFFYYFSFVEVLTMIIGTLIGAVLFFLFFEFMFS